MTTSTHKYKYIYIKNGNVIDQIKRIAPLNNKPIQSGPDAFLADLLYALKDEQLLVISHYNKNMSYVYDNIKAIELDCIPKSTSPIRKIYNRFNRIKQFLILIIIMIRFKPDRIICGRLGFMLWATWIVSKLRNIPYIHSRHIRINRSDMSYLKKIEDNIDKWVVSKATACICHGPYTKQQLTQEGIPISKIFEFDISFYDFLSHKDDDIHIEQLKNTGDFRIILFVGRISQEKGVFDLLDACKDILKENIKLVYVGEGRDFNKLKDIIDQRNLKNKVILLGNIAHEYLPKLYKLAYIVVTPTQQAKEGRCMSAMESLIMNVPVIAPNGGPFPFLIKHEINGLLYTTDSIQDLTLKINRIFADTKLYKNLINGAHLTGLNLIEPELSFSRAIQKAFQLS